MSFAVLLSDRGVGWTLECRQPRDGSVRQAAPAVVELEVSVPDGTAFALRFPPGATLSLDERLLAAFRRFRPDHPAYSTESVRTR